jgi:AcrR family transcriptional regulator
LGTIVNLEVSLDGLLARVPKQGRSRASIHRILEAAQRLLEERGPEDFTVSEITVLAGVSVGAVYGYFESKDRLIQAVQMRAYGALQAEQTKAIEEAVASASNLPELVREIVEVVAESLRAHRKLLRAFIFHSYSDPVVAAGGTSIYRKLQAEACKAMLQRRCEMTHPQPERGVEAVHRMLYAVFSRVLGFTVQTEVAEDPMDWHAAKTETIAMAITFLTATPHPLSSLPDGR